MPIDGGVSCGVVQALLWGDIGLHEHHDEGDETANDVKGVDADEYGCESGETVWGEEVLGDLIGEGDEAGDLNDDKECADGDGGENINAELFNVAFEKGFRIGLFDFIVKAFGLIRVGGVGVKFLCFGGHDVDDGAGDDEDECGIEEDIRDDECAFGGCDG